MMATNNDFTGNRLQHLKGSNYEVADGQPDIRGWDVKDEAGKTFGEVKDLIFDTQSLKVRYMVVDLDDKDFDLNDREVLVPIGIGELHEKGDDVILPGVTAAQLTALPEYKDTVSANDEYTIRNVFAGVGAAGLGAAAATTAGADNDFYNHEHYNQDNLYKRRNALTAATDTTAAPGAATSNSTTPVTDTATTDTTIPVIEESLEVGKRTVQTGGAYIKSRIVEKPVEETVTLQKENVRIERNPVDRPANTTDFDNFKEGVVEIEEHAEVPVVSKEARVVEEISINKEAEERTETVRDTIRKTEVDIEKLDNTAGGNRYDNKQDI
jgi:uncharacterized protein (TIGR02271 family)